VSGHNNAGRTGRPTASSSTTPCICPRSRSRRPARVPPTAAAQRAHERLPPRVGRDFGPAGPRRRQRIRFARDRALDAVGIERDEFDGAGAEVDSEQAHDGTQYSNERMSMIAGSRRAPASPRFFRRHGNATRPQRDAARAHAARPVPCRQKTLRAG
jgi:hypothetical protein